MHLIRRKFKRVIFQEPVKMSRVADKIINIKTT